MILDFSFSSYDFCFRVMEVIELSFLRDGIVNLEFRRSDLLTLLNKLCRLFPDVLHRFPNFLEQLHRGALLVKRIVLSHDVADLLHHTVEFQRHTNGLRYIARVLDAHAQQLGYLFEPALVSRANDVVAASLVNELDDAIGLTVFRRLARYGVSVDRTDHEVLDVSNLRLVVDLIDEASLFFSIVADDEVTTEEDLAGEADVWREDDEVLGLLLVELLHALGVGLRLVDTLNDLFLLWPTLHSSGGGRDFSLLQQGRCFHVNCSLRIMRQASIVIVVTQVCRRFRLVFKLLRGRVREHLTSYAYEQRLFNFVTTYFQCCKQEHRRPQSRNTWVQIRRFCGKDRRSFSKCTLPM